MSRDRREMLSCGRRLIVIGRIVFCLAIFSCANGEVVAQDPLELLENSMVSVVEAVEPSVVSIARIPLENVGRMSNMGCLLYTSPSPRDLSTSRMPSSA